MDLYCPKCGEPWDHDSLHDEAAERYGVPYYLPEDDPFVGRPPRQKNPAYDSDAYGKVFRTVSREFRVTGCPALQGTCSEPSTQTDRTFGLTPQVAAAALYDILGDDTDGAAAMLEDMGF